MEITDDIFLQISVSLYTLIRLYGLTVGVDQLT